MKPTQQMIAAAKLGLSQGNVDNGAVAVVAQKIASGDELTIETIVDIRRAHGTSLSEQEKLLWGGVAGEAWAKSVVSAADRMPLGAEPDVDVTALLSGDDDVSFEIFLENNLDEPITLGADDNGWIWSPILRSGMTMTRPGPYGEKIHDPLVFVAGKSDDQHAAIGLQDVLDAFKDNAVQHVTIPTSHDNSLLDNTGYIKDMRIVESKKMPGEKVLIAAHHFTEPDIRGKVERGTIGNRSCGLLYDYVNPTTGKRYPIALEHVALTNQPWVHGMTAYGDLSEADLSDRTVVSVALSERPTKIDPEPSKVEGFDYTKLSDEECKRSCLIRFSDNGRDTLLLPVRDAEGKIVPEAVKAAAEKLPSVAAPLAEKREAAKVLLSMYRDQLKEEAPEHLQKYIEVSTQMSEQDRLGYLNLSDIQWGDDLSWRNVENQLTNLLQSMATVSFDVYPIYYLVDVSLTSLKAGKALIRANYGISDLDDAWVAPFTVNGDDIELAPFDRWTAVEKKWVKAELAEPIVPVPSHLSEDPLKAASARRLGLTT